MRLQALIFDVDGTLADTEETHRAAFNQAFEELGLHWNWSRPTYAHLLETTGGKERLAAYASSLPADQQHRVSDRIAEIHARKTEIYGALILAGKAPLRDGVARLIAEAHGAGIRLAIASTTTYENIEALLRVNLGLGALEHFDVVGAGDMAQHKKPAPDIYEYVLRELGLPAEYCAAIEDSANGLQAAKRAGLFTVVTPSYWTKTEDFSGADLVVPSLGSDERPLPPRVQLLVGAPVVGVSEIERNLIRQTRVRQLHPNNALGGL